MSRHNRTNHWLAGKDPDVKAALLTLVRPNGRQLRAWHREQERIVRLRIQEKLAENRRVQMKKAAKAAQQKVSGVLPARAVQMWTG